jgi:hypothetical protein
MPSLRITLVNGSTHDVAIGEDADPEHEIKSFLEGVGAYEGDWIAVDNSGYVRRDAVIQVAPRPDFPMAS